MLDDLKTILGVKREISATKEHYLYLVIRQVPAENFLCILRQELS